ncbi:Transposase DDE domain-containing protein [Streptomyces sp. Ncost-T10-10d]|nr:Transposase DDE domain-containing protein [Streptomyces sp. Ncost-T10-10d]
MGRDTSLRAAVSGTVLLILPGLHGRIAHKGEKAPIQAGERWHVERTHAWQNAFHRLACCYERRATVANAFFDLADTITAVRSLIRRAWTTHRWDHRPKRRP